LAGIAPGYIAAQLVGAAALGFVVVLFLHPDAPASADDVVAHTRLFAG
jgi:hypothetical protein